MLLPLIGEIRPFAGTIAPRGWALCDGRLLDQQKNELLYRIIGKQFGGTETEFALPNLCGRIPLHTGGKDSYPMGSRGGLEQVALTEAQLPAHTHPVFASSNITPDAKGPQDAFWGSASTTFSWALAPGDQIMHPDSIKATGEGHAHDNRIPFMALSYIIALEGILPND